MSSAASLRTLAGSLDGSLGRRVRASNGTMLSRYLSDPQRHEKITCGTATINAKIAPAEDITAMKSKIRAIIPKAPGGGSAQGPGQ
ncbi:hypothetical protein V8E51_015500 [Hyaloscypha variabilis]